MFFFTWPYTPATQAAMTRIDLSARQTHGPWLAKVPWYEAYQKCTIRYKYRMQHVKTVLDHTTVKC